MTQRSNTWETKFIDLDLSVRALNKMLMYFMWCTEKRMTKEEVYEMTLHELYSSMNEKDYLKMRSAGIKSLEEFKSVVNEVKSKYGDYTGGISGDKQVVVMLTMAELKQLIRDTIKDAISSK